MYTFPPSADADRRPSRVTTPSRVAAPPRVAAELRAARELTRDPINADRTQRRYDLALDVVADRILDAFEIADAQPPEPDPREAADRIPGRRPHRAPPARPHTLRLVGRVDE